MKKTTKPKLTQKQRDELMAEFGHIPSQDEVFAKLAASHTRMMEAFKGAWETMPDDPEIRAEMVKALEQVANLDRGIKEMMGEAKKTGEKK